MARVYPQAPFSLTYMSTEKQVFTIWMKSLVYQTSGLTAYNSRGEIAYRVENYGRKYGSTEVHVMDLRGNILYTIEKKVRFFGSWYVCRCGDSSSTSMKRDKPLFRVGGFCGIFMRSSDFEVKVGNEIYWIMRLDSKAAFQIIDINGDVLAEVKQKHSLKGIKLGEDVLALEMKPCVDHSIVVAIVTVYGLIKRKI